MKKQRPKIESITIRHTLDDNADLSWLGEYTDKRPPDEDLKRKSAWFRRNAARSEFKYFVCAISVEEHREGLQDVGYSRGVAEEMAREYCKQDFRRMERYCSGDLYNIGIDAEACVSYATNGTGSKRLEWFTSGGVWGYESDADVTEIAEEEEGQLKALIEHLKTFNVDCRGWRKKVTRQEELRY